MADEMDNDDQWLYGDAPDVPAAAETKDPEEEQPPSQPAEEDRSETPPLVSKEPEENEKPSEPVEEPQNDTEEVAPPGTTPEQEESRGGDGDEEEEGEKQNGDGSDKEDSEEDSDDDVNVVIGDIKTNAGAYTSLNIKRGGLLTSTVTDKSKQQQPQQAGKFTVEEFDQMGMINGVAVTEFNLDSLEDKPWRKPGADITDYFNYGFNEDTWKAYCERQKRIRVNESGVGLVPLNAIGLPRGPIPIMNDNSKYSGAFGGVRKAGPPPGRRMTGAIDVIGGAAQPGSKMDAPKENIIQVMTADRREYSRKPPGFPDLSMPPPSAFEEFQPEFGFNPEPDPFYGGGYEPTQDLQWAPVPPVGLGPPMLPPMMKDGTPPRLRSRDRDREISRSRSEKPRDRERERSHRRERSRSRSRRHKSRSRSPGHRHRKKKSRRHEDSD